MFSLVGQSGIESARIEETQTILARGAYAVHPSLRRLGGGEEPGGGREKGRGVKYSSTMEEAERRGEAVAVYDFLP
ncbi:hypothetical protein PRIPAC_71109 [Pristionchus pacificus]|uniref:Uncharacterized protein n=1 Tax=Pristionchus pacificus TaxID=54126 RepID=A0A2A6C890_PRIPA|nr:hypothetical protein PRIPAC_71109 [Pristionchus pacificus]|eukprot:PDM74320.1 hypothetical protein PRIPAC_41676 [Pristionchus pacificus]